MKVHFYYDAIQDDAATEREGYPMYRDVEMIRISNLKDAGGSDTTLVIDTAVSEDHKRRFPEQYRAFASTERKETNGTPIKMWPVATPALIRALADISVFTVEELAEIGGKELRERPWLKSHHERAVNWLQTLVDTSATLKLEAKVKELELQVETLRTKNEELMKTLRAKGKEKAAA